MRMYGRRYCRKIFFHWLDDRKKNNQLACRNTKYSDTKSNQTITTAGEKLFRSEIEPKNMEVAIEKDYLENTKNQEYNTVKKYCPNVDNVGVREFDLFTGSQFKDLIERYFKQRGYSVSRIVPRVKCIDFIISNDNEIIALATKKTTELISRAYVCNVFEAAKNYNTLTSIMVISSSWWHPQAVFFAEKNNIIMWDRDILIEKLGSSNEIFT